MEEKATVLFLYYAKIEEALLRKRTHLWIILLCININFVISQCALRVDIAESADI